MPKKAKTGLKSYPLTKAQERRIMALAVQAVRADWDAEHARLNRRSVETPVLTPLAEDLATQGTCFAAEVERHAQAFGIAERTDPSEVVRRMQAERDLPRRHIHLTCTRPNPEQIAEGIAAAADHLALTTETDQGGGQSPPPPSDPAPQAAFDAAVAATKATFSLKESPPFQKNNNFDADAFSAEVERWLNSPPSDTTANGTQSSETAPAKNEIFRPTFPDDPEPWADPLERAMLEDGIIQRAATRALGGEDAPAPDDYRGPVPKTLFLASETPWYVTASGQWWQAHHDAQGREWVVLAPTSPAGEEATAPGPVDDAVINDGTALRPVGDHAWDYAPPQPGDPKSPWSDCVFTGDTITWMGEERPIFRTDYGRGDQYIRTRTGAVVAVKHMNRAPAAAPDPSPGLQLPCFGAVWTTGSWGQQVCSHCLTPQEWHLLPAAPDPVPSGWEAIDKEVEWKIAGEDHWCQVYRDQHGREWFQGAAANRYQVHNFDRTRPTRVKKNDSPPANTHLGTMPGGQPLGPPKVNDPRTWWEAIMTDIEALPLFSQLTLSPWQARRLYDALHGWGYRSGRTR